MAENERGNIRQRQAEGIVATKARGVRFGRPERELPESFPEICECWKAGELSNRAAAKACGMPVSSVRYRAKKGGRNSILFRPPFSYLSLSRIITKKS